MDDNDVVNKWLQESNLLRKDNCYFMASELRIPEGFMLYEPFVVKANDEELYAYIINYTEEGLGILPLCNGIRSDLAIFISFDNINKVTVHKGLFYNKVYILIDNNKILSLRVNNKDIYLKEQKRNVKRFLKDSPKTIIEEK